VQPLIPDDPTQAPIAVDLALASGAASAKEASENSPRLTRDSAMPQIAAQQLRQVKRGRKQAGIGSAAAIAR